MRHRKRRIGCASNALRAAVPIIGLINSKRVSHNQKRSNIDVQVKPLDRRPTM